MIFSLCVSRIVFLAVIGRVDQVHEVGFVGLLQVGAYGPQLFLALLHELYVRGAFVPLVQSFAYLSESWKPSPAHSYAAGAGHSVTFTYPLHSRPYALKKIILSKKLGKQFCRDNY